MSTLEPPKGWKLFHRLVLPTKGSVCIVEASGRKRCGWPKMNIRIVKIIRVSKKVSIKAHKPIKGKWGSHFTIGYTIKKLLSSIRNSRRRFILYGCKLTWVESSRLKKSRNIREHQDTFGTLRFQPYLGKRESNTSDDLWKSYAIRKVNGKEIIYLLHRTFTIKFVLTFRK